MTLSIDDVIATFDMLDAWEDRYRYLIDLGRSLAPLDDSERNEDNRVRGCASQVWVVTEQDQTADGRLHLSFRGDSDAHIVKGLVALVLSFYNHKSPQDILDSDVMALFKQLGLSEHLTPQRSNGVRSMVERIRRDASHCLAKH
jgi:cysteine desulfuration protein SufE